MAPRTSTARRGAPQPAPDQNPLQPPSADEPNVNTELFLDPMLGTPLAVYIEKDVENRDELAHLVTGHGGTISQGYSGVTYILVDPHKNSGQNLYRQYAGKKTKIVLDARWIRECVRTGLLQGFPTQWAGCKVTGEEEICTGTGPRMEDMATNQPQLVAQPVVQMVAQPVPQLVAQPVGQPVPQPAAQPVAQPAPQPEAQPVAQPMPREQAPQPTASTSAQPSAPPPPPPPSMPYPMPITPAVMVDPFSIYAPQMAQPPANPSAAQTWHMPHMIRPTQPFREEPHWPEFPQPQDNLATNQGTFAGEYRYRENNPPWLPTPPGTGFYDPTAYDQNFGQQPFLPDAPPPPDAPVEDPSSSLGSGLPEPMDVAPTTGTLEPPERPRGRKRARMQPMPAVPAETLVNRTAGPARRSPTPPTRVIKSTYGGNLFTADDVLYLKKYIDYCQEQGLVLSLREICERIAVKAPHHTFFSWRRYCNKHQIRLGGYVMNAARGESPTMDGEAGMDIEEESGAVTRGPASTAPSSSRVNVAAARAAAFAPRNRSPTPPRALYRSTTGKGVAFTQEDVDFLMKLLRYRETQGRVDQVQFWKEVATKAPHHSRASWMKFWRRHKHELVIGEDDGAPIPVPEKKVRYSKEDDILLAKFFHGKPEGTSDKLFQGFARVHPHHPWKGWQEHHRIHKAKIDHLIEMLESGQDIDNES